MPEHIFIISPRRFQKRDIKRFGVEYLKKKKKSYYARCIEFN